MRLFKSITMIVFVTTLALVYVHQQVELVKLSYAIELKDRKVKDMLDRKEALSYNIENLAAPSRLERVLLSKKIDIAFPKKAHVFKAANYGVNRAIEGNLKTAGLERKVAILKIFEFFMPRAEAQAKER